VFYSSYQAGRLEQFDHSRNPFRVLFFLSGRSPGTIWPLAKPFSRFILYRAGRLEQFDHLRNPFRVLFFLSGRSPGTIWPLAKPFSRFILPIGQVAWNNFTTHETLVAFYSSYRAGRLEQLDHSRIPFRVLFFLSGRSSGTIRPLAKPFSRFILYRASHLEQLDHPRNPFRVLLSSDRLPKIIWSIKKKTIKKKVGCLPNDLFLDFYISL
jgi:hypothetical protein